MTKVTVQKEAAAILEESKIPLKSSEIARRILERGKIESLAKDPIQSFAQTLERNLRNSVGNKPALVFVETEDGRCIGLEKIDYSYYENNMGKSENEKSRGVDSSKLVKVYLTEDVIRNVKIYELTQGSLNTEAAIVELIEAGLKSVASQVLDKVRSQLENSDKK